MWVGRNTSRRGRELQEKRCGRKERSWRNGVTPRSDPQAHSVDCVTHNTCQTLRPSGERTGAILKTSRELISATFQQTFYAKPSLTDIQYARWYIAHVLPSTYSVINKTRDIGSSREPCKLWQREPCESFMVHSGDCSIHPTILRRVNLPEAMWIKHQDYTNTTNHKVELWSPTLHTKYTIPAWY